MAAITTLLLRAASSVAPLAIRVLARRQYYHSALLRPLALGNRLSPELRGGSPFPSHPFSSLRHRLYDPSLLLDYIFSEIKYAEQNDEIPNEFPFKIVDEPGTKAITLTRHYYCQHIEVSVSMPDLVTGEESEDGEDDDSKDNVDDAEKGAQSSIQLVVKTYNKNRYGLNVEFYCTAYADEVTIDEMCFLEGGTETYLLFSNLDEADQKTTLKYLEFIGISPRTTNFLLKYMINKDKDSREYMINKDKDSQDKDSQEYVIWLKELQDFVQKRESRIM